MRDSPRPGGMNPGSVIETAENFNLLISGQNTDRLADMPAGDQSERPIQARD